MEAVSETILGQKIGAKPRIGKKILDQKISVKNYFAQKIGKIVLVGEKFCR